MDKIIYHFNKVFAGSAKAVLKGDRLEITINTITFIVSLPDVIGAQSKGSSQAP